MQIETLICETGCLQAAITVKPWLDRIKICMLVLTFGWTRKIPIPYGISYGIISPLQVK